MKKIEKIGWIYNRTVNNVLGEAVNKINELVEAYNQSVSQPEEGTRHFKNGSSIEFGKINESEKLKGVENNTEEILKETELVCSWVYDEKGWHEEDNTEEWSGSEIQDITQRRAEKLMWEKSIKEDRKTLTEFFTILKPFHKEAEYYVDTLKRVLSERSFSKEELEIIKEQVISASVDRKVDRLLSLESN